MEKISGLSKEFTDYRGEALPAYKLLKKLITQHISSGTWSSGEPVPSENEMAQALGLSRMTINRAIRELTAEGLLYRTQGVGTFVAQQKNTSALFEVKNIAEEITARGHTHQSRVILLEEIAAGHAPWPTGETLGNRVFHSVLVHCDNGAPLQREERLVNAEVTPHYLDQDFTSTTPNVYLGTCHPITRGTHTVEAVLPSAQQAQELEIDPAEPCLKLLRTTWSGDTVISQVALLYPGSRGRLEGSFGI